MNSYLINNIKRAMDELSGSAIFESPAWKLMIAFRAKISPTFSEAQKDELVSCFDVSKISTEMTTAEIDYLASRMFELFERIKDELKSEHFHDPHAIAIKLFSKIAISV